SEVSGEKGSRVLSVTLTKGRLARESKFTAVRDVAIAGSSRTSSCSRSRISAPPRDGCGWERCRPFTRLVFGQFDKDASSRAGVEESNSLPLGADAGRFVDEPDARRSTAVERSVEVPHGKANMMDAGSAARHERGDR